MTRYQNTKVTLVSTARAEKGKSAFAQWVRENYSAKYIVSVSPFDVNGDLAQEPLKMRGYEFSGAGKDSVVKGILVGKQTWFKSFDTETEADAEIEILCDVGI